MLGHCSSRARCAAAVLCVATLLAGATAHADGGSWLAPLTLETAETLPSGQIDIALGASYFNNRRYPPFTPSGYIRSQSLTTVPEIGVRGGAGSMVEIQASYEFIDLNESTIDGHHSVYGGGDARLFTKVYAVRERTWVPAMGFRFGVKLPNASSADRLGTDETDFHIQWLVSKRFGPIAAHVNLGLSILGNPGFDPDNASGQDDLFTYDVGVVSPTWGAEDGEGWGARALLEVAGATGSRFDNDGAAMRGGVQVVNGGWTLYLGASGGLASAAEKYGFMGGVIYAFDVDRLAALFE